MDITLSSTSQSRYIFSLHRETIYQSSSSLEENLLLLNRFESPACQGTKDEEWVSIVVGTIYAPGRIVEGLSFDRILCSLVRSERRPCIEKAARSFRTYIALARHEVRSPLSSVLSRECPFRFPVSLRFRSLYLFLLLLLSPLDGVPGFVRPRRRANCVHYLSSRG